MADKLKFCPEWLYKIIISLTVYDYVVRDIAIFVSTKKFESFFKKYYEDLTVDDIENGATAFIQFLGEVKAKDPFLLLNHFTYTIIKDIKPNQKGLFKKIPMKVMTKNIILKMATQDFRVLNLFM